MLVTSSSLTSFKCGLTGGFGAGFVGGFNVGASLTGVTVIVKFCASD